MPTRQSMEDFPQIPVLNVFTDRETNEPVVVVAALNAFDSTRPDNWSSSQKSLVLAAGLISDFNSTLGSSLPSNCTTHIAETFDVGSDFQLALPISVYVVGFIFGPMFYGPLSESFGRKQALLLPFIIYMAFTLGCTLSTSWSMFLVFRFICGFAASSPIAIVGGLFPDIYSDERVRGYYLTYFIAVSGFGPCLGPFVSGFISAHTSWRWAFWTAFFLALATLPLLVAMPETYQPTLLRRRAGVLRGATGNDHIISNSIADLREPREIITIVLARPFRMLATEAIVFFSCLYLALIYGVFYLTFEAWPLAFVGIYHMSNAVSSLTYLPFGIGTILSVVIFFQYDKYVLEAQAHGAEWSFKAEYRRLPLACIGGPLWSVSLFWIGWSAKADIHWIVPVLSGVCFGAGYLLIFIAILNYLADAYTIYSASAQSISSTTRSICGALLPLAAAPLFKRLGFHWACSLLGFISTVMIPIPFVFLRWGHVLRSKSKFRQELQMLRGENREMDATALTSASALSVIDGGTAAAEIIVAPDQQLSALLAISEMQRKGGSIRGSIDPESGVVTTSHLPRTTQEREEPPPLFCTFMSWEELESESLTS